jgi:glutamine amidotransferase-like uncharacterized protein
MTPRRKIDLGSFTFYHLRIVVSLVLMVIALTGCGGRGGEGSTVEAPKAGDKTAVLLFNGTGTSPNDVKAFEAILKSHMVEYATANSAQLNAMSEAQLGEFKLLLVPGGNFIEVGTNLTSNAVANIRGAVRNGLNYHGVCAGALFAGNSPFNGANMTSGVHFKFYSASNAGIRKTNVLVTMAGSAALDQYWEDGPQLSGWGEVVAKYPDGTPAVAQGKFGDGWVVLSGVHAEAPENWRGGMKFNTPAEKDHEFAWKLIEAAMNRTALPHF